MQIEGGRWLPTAQAQPWPSMPWAQRWSVLAGAWLERLPEEIRMLLAERAGAQWGEQLLESLRWLFPLGGEWMRSRLKVYTRDAELLGVVAEHVPSTAGSTLLIQGPQEAAAVMATGFPPAVDTVYLQQDLSIVAPGALRPDLDARLRELADRDGASTYRVSATSLTRALALGRTAQDIGRLLESMTRTGMPQALAYLLRRDEHAVRRGAGARRSRGDRGARFRRPAAARRGSRPGAGSAGLDAHGGIAAQQAGPRRGFLGTERRAVSGGGRRRIRPDSDAASPRGVPGGGPGRAARPGRTLGWAPLTPAADPRAWLERQLDIAIRGKLALTVTVQLPDGSPADYQLEPTSMAGGRLRARDRAADIERTLPLASITAVAPGL